MIRRLLRRCGWIVPISSLLLAGAISLASAEPVATDVDPIYPSGGSGHPRIVSGGGTVTVDIEGTEPVAPRQPVADSSPHPYTPSATLLISGQSKTPSIDGGFIYKPPDTHMAVGTGAGAAGRLILTTNAGITIYDKTGSIVAGPTDMDAFLGLGSIGSANTSFDPKVIFDQLSSRFFIVVAEGSDPTPVTGLSNVHVAVSTSATPANTSSDWTFFNADAKTSVGGFNTWLDYPSVGADSTRFVVTGNLFDSGDLGRGTKIRVYDKAALTSGTQTFTDFNIDSSVTAGIGTVQPAHVFGSTLNGDFYLINRFGSTAYRLWQLTGTAASPSFVTGSFTTLRTWTAGSLISAGAPQSGITGITIDTLSPRLINAVYRSGRIWCALAADTDADSKTEVVWFSIDPNTLSSATPGVLTTPSVNQSGSIDGSTASAWTFLPAIGVNGTGDAVIVYSQSSPSQFVDMRAVARNVADTANTFQSPVVIATSAGEYDDFSSDDPERWGDYAACAVDPDDDETFWVAHEIVQTDRVSGDDSVWGTRIAKLGPVVVPVELSGFSVE